MIRLLSYSQDADLQCLLAATLCGDFSVRLENGSGAVREIISQGQCDVLVLDLDARPHPIHQLFGFFDEIRDLGVPVVVMTDDDTRATALDLVQRGVYNYIRKPPVLPELKIVVRRAHEFAVLGRELEQARQLSRPSGEEARQQLALSGCDRLIGSSALSQEFYDLIRRVAARDATALITGESGTGKELVAHAIHSLSDRKESPFVAVACGAIPDTLIEAELFGAEKGAFTGAATRRKGYLEDAGNGTLFFDEIGELSAYTQVKLLRVLQEREFSRLGSSQLIPLKARPLFATHRNLLEMVKEGTFRHDLYYRVNVVEIKTPPLRDHREDIPAMAQHFLQEYSQRYQKSMTGVTPNAMALLLEYEWPGNVRELENAIQRAIVLSDDDTVQPKDLPQAMQHPTCRTFEDSLPAASFEEQLHNYKNKIVYKSLQECNGNVTHAARSLQMSRTYLHRIIRENVSASDHPEEEADDSKPDSDYSN
jgi:DNA-binding NtrC family response regulator